MPQQSSSPVNGPLTQHYLGSQQKTPSSPSGFVLPRPVLGVLVALGLLFAIDLFALAAYRDLKQASDELAQHMHTAQALQALPRYVLEMDSGMRGYILSGAVRSLNRYRSAAEAFPRAAQQAVLSGNVDARQRKLMEAAVASAENWLGRYASPLVVKRNVADGEAQAVAEIIQTLRKDPRDRQIDRIRAQFDEVIQIERDRGSAAELALNRKLDRVSRWMRWRALALLLALSALTLMLGRTLARLTGQIRSREAAESAMRTSSATMRAMGDASPLGMFLANVSGACIQSNVAFERITGLVEADVLGSGWQSALHVEDKERVISAWSDATVSGTAFASVHRFVHANGKVVWTSMKSAGMNDGERLIGFVCSIEDISGCREAEEALRKSEERLNVALESSHLALFEWHIPSGEVFLSCEWNIMTGNGQQPLTTTARRLNDLVHPEDLDAVSDAIIGMLRTNKPIYRMEFRIQTRSAQWKRVYCNGRVTERDSAGRAVRLMGTIATD